MRVMKIVLPILMLACLLSACGKDKTALKEEDLSLTVGGVQITTEADVADLLATFGEDYAYAEAVSCVYDGMDKSFTYEDFTIYTYPSEQGDCLMEIYCQSGDVTTAKGISIGASLSDVTELYGTDYEEKGATIVYALPLSQADCEPASLYFLISNDTVSAIGMTTEHRTE